MTDLPEERKIISIATRRPVDETVDETSGEIVEAKKLHIDEDTVKVAEHLLELIKTGRYSGLCIVAWNRQDSCFFTEFLAPEDDHIDNSAFRFHGALGLIQQQLLEVASESFAMESEV